MKSDRFLVNILVGIAGLVILALVFFFIRQRSQNYLPEDTPAGVVNNFILAASRGDFERAYQYLAEVNSLPTREYFRTSFLAMQPGFAEVSVQINDTVLSGDQATVMLTIIQGNNGPFGSTNRSLQMALLVRQNGAWKITQMPYPFWSYDWVQPVPQGEPPMPVIPPATP